MRIVVVFVVIACVCLVVFNLNNGVKSIDELLKDQVSGGRTPSIQYAFFDSDTILYHQFHGRRSIDPDLPVDSTTTYHLFSITKTFTALSVLQLVREGKVGLDDPVSRYLPDFNYDQRITIGQLLSHTAGMPNPIPLRWIHLESEHASFDEKAFFDRIFKDNPGTVAEPGTKFKYSNLGYVVLGQLVEKVSGQSFKSYVEVNIIDRIGIPRSDLSFTLDTTTHAIGYHKRWSFSNAILRFLIDKEKFMESSRDGWKPFRHFYNNGVPYGGMFGNARGLIAYGQAILREDSLLLDTSGFKNLFTERKVGGRPTGMSLSWFTGSLTGHRYFVHAGGGGGYYVELRLYPELRKGSVILFNRSGMTDERFLDSTDTFFLTPQSNQ